MKEKVILFGASGLLIKVHYYLNNEFDILCICDNNEKKWGSDLFGVKIISPENLKGYEYDRIIVTSSYYDDIKPQLIFLDVNIEKLFYVDICEKIDSYKFNIFFEIKKLNLYNDIRLAENNFPHLINSNFINIKQSKIFDIEINNIDLKNLKSQLKKYFNSDELLENTIMSVRETVDFIYTNKFNIIKCLYNLENKFLMNKIFKFLSIASTMPANKDLIRNMIEEVFGNKNLTFVEKAHYYSMLGCISGENWEYRHGYKHEMLLINFSD